MITMPMWVAVLTVISLLTSIGLAVVLNNMLDKEKENRKRDTAHMLNEGLRQGRREGKNDGYGAACQSVAIQLREIADSLDTYERKDTISTKPPDFGAAAKL